MHMAMRPGFCQKHLPIRLDTKSGNYLSGGRYLFDTVELAEAYRSWAQSDFVLDGIKFFERPVFFDPVCYVWKVVGGQDWASPASHALIRSELWRLTPGHECDLEQAWLQIWQEAEAVGMASVRLLHNEAEQMVGLVSIARRVTSIDLRHPDDANLHGLETSPSLGTMFEEPNWVKVFDRTSWVLTIWSPIAEGKPDGPAIWPNSPPMPAPAYAMAAP
jgi:hypothetical protein